MYRISRYSYARAKALGVQIKPSTRKGKKIDVFKGGKKVASIGAYGMKDFPSYKALEADGRVPKGTANKRRAAYKARHQKDRTKMGSAGYYADQILW